MFIGVLHAIWTFRIKWSKNSRKEDAGILPKLVIQSYKDLKANCLRTWFKNSTPSKVQPFMSH